MLKNKIITFSGSIIALTLFASMANNTNANYVPKATSALSSSLVKESNDEQHTIWENDGSLDLVCWGGYARFCLDGTDPGGLCIASFPQNTWDIFKSHTFYVNFLPTLNEFVFRVTTGWWDPVFNDFNPSACIPNPDGTYTAEINFSGHSILDALDYRNLLFTGGDYYLKKIYYVTSDPTPVPTTHEATNNNKYEDRDQNHGYLTLSTNEVEVDQTCTITVNPLRGYALKEGSLKVVSSADPTVTYDVTLPDPDIEWVYTFTMPDNDVIISAEFVEAPLPLPPNAYTGKDITHWVFLGTAVALVGFVLILWFVFKIRNFHDKKKDKINVAPFVGFAIHLAAVAITSFLIQCLLCYILLGVNALLLIGAITLYALYKKKEKE